MEVLEEKIILRKGNSIKEILNKDIQVIRIKFLRNIFARLLLLLIFGSVLIACFFKIYLGVFEVLIILSFLSYVLFFEFEKCNAKLTIITNSEKIRFRINSKKIELSFEIIERLHMKDYKASTGKVYIFRNVA